MHGASRTSLVRPSSPFCHNLLTPLQDLIGPLMEQPQYNMLTRNRVEVEYSGLYRKHGLGLTVFSPLMRGILTGKYNNGIPDDSRANKAGAEWFKKQIVEGQATLENVKKLEPIASKLGASMSQLALAWVVKNERVSSAIIGATSVQQINENLDSLKFVEKLTPDVLEEIDTALGNKPTALPMRFT